MKSSLVLTVTTACMLASQTFAGTMGTAPTQDWNWVGSVATGPVWANAGQTQTFYMAPNIIKTWVANKSSNVLAAGEVFIGVQQTATAQWLGQWGLAVATTGKARLQGIIWDDADPQFDNYSYQYKVQNTRITARGKLLFDQNFWLMPFVNASLGVGFNRASSYSNTPLIFPAVCTPDFANHTKTTFSWTVGAGVQVPIGDHWQLGAGYEFADWGKSALGRAIGQTLNTGLTMNHLYTNGILFNLTYVV